MSQHKLNRLFNLVALIGGTALWFALPESSQAQETPAVVTKAAALEDQGIETVPVLPVQVAPNNPQLHYSGRFDLSQDVAQQDVGQPAMARCSWPASGVTLHFRGSAANASLGLGENRFTVVLDGQPIKRLTGKVGDSKETPEVRLYALTSGLSAGEHTLTLFKNTETNVGDATFAGFQLPAGGVALAVAPFPRQIEVIGDSISAGYGIEGANQNEHFLPATENAYLTYGALAARAVGADYTCIAWSGRTLWPTFTIPEIYNRTLPGSSQPVWKGDARSPDVFLINLATNEFGRPQNPDEEGWVKAYRDFLGQLRQKAPNATIYCALGPMLTDTWPPQRKVRSVARSYLERVVRESNAAGDAKVHFLEFEVQNAVRDGLGSDWHPNVRTNQIMADKLVSALRADLGWQSR